MSNDYLGLAGPSDASSRFNAMAFIVRSMLGQVWTATVVQVMAVYQGGGAVAVAGTVDIMPLVNQLDGNNQATPHGTIYGVPYLRLQGGSNAIIIDPEVGDLGIAIFADHDISSVIANQGQANPGSRRRFSPSDAMYLGGLLNDEPDQYIDFAGGIVMGSPGVSTTGNFGAGSGASGTFTSATGQVITVIDGIIVGIV